MAVIISCSGTVTETSQGYPKCETGWTQVPDTVFNSPSLSTEDFGELWAYVIAFFAVAIGVKYLRKIFDTNGGRNA